VNFDLSLTSPLESGEAVRRAQRRLKENRFRAYYRGEVDGEYGVKTAAATKSAKYWLGFPKRNVNGRYTNKLHGILKGDPLPLTFRVRRAARIKAAMPTQREKALRLAKAELGTNENPAGTNRVKYSEWYGMIGAWCAMFVTWCYVQAGNKTTFEKGKRYAFVPFVVADARAGRNGLSTVSNPIPGDLVTYQFDSDSNADHIGIYEVGLGDGWFNAIEGNTSVTSQDDGGEVMRRKRHRSQVVEFIRVQAG
jgi:peptidoglycan hydrolase-like protein with peptidoglycan-binding domain